MEIVRQNVLEMLKNRNKTIVDGEGEIIKVSNKEGEITYIFLYNELKLNINGVKDYISVLERDEIKHALIIMNDMITSSAVKLIANLADNIYIECFKFGEMYYNLTQHRLYNRHESLTKQEAQEFIKRYGKDIPTILKTDIVCRYFNFKKGEIIKIYRKNGYVNYRIVKG